jgi:hypothetical protein
MRKKITYGQYAGFLNTLSPQQAEERYDGRRLKRSGKAPNFSYSAGDDAWGRNFGALSWADGAAWAAWAGLRPMTELEYEKAVRGPMDAGWDTGDGLDHPSYWDIDDMNGWRLMPERTVTVGNEAGRRFRGTHGRGTPDLPEDWPPADAVGAGTRGGCGPSGDPSCRIKAAVVNAERPQYGAWRGVRTAPKEAAEH